MQKILVTGGCGFIGSHTVVDLKDLGFSPLSIDNYSNANREVEPILKEMTKGSFENADIDLAGDYEELRKIPFLKEVDAIIHFAAFKAVGESVDNPLMYYHNNMNSLLNVLRLAEEFDIKNIIFSSSCSVYGNTNRLPVNEDVPREDAESPYARTKQMGEDVLMDYANANPDIRIIALRYFNPCGAHPSAKIGESSLNPPSNLVPVIMEVGAGKREKITIFGDDYPTRDGTCIRDYIHVMDLARAHTLAVKYLLEGLQDQAFDIINLGAGEGYSVTEMVNAFESTTNTKLKHEYGPRRAGDVIQIYCDYTKAKSILGWEPKYGVEAIMRDAWAWEQKRTF
jgi:UDP-glucose 4-epimerase